MPRDDIERRIVIVGASARSAAHSALRAGLRPICADIFADDDLRAAAELLPMARYPLDLPQAVGSAPEAPWMYTGALENHPRIVAAIASERRLLGNGVDVLKRVRNPLFVAETLRSADLPMLEVRPGNDPPPTGAGWLLKPLHSAGGRGIRLWSAETAAARKQPGCYFQQWAAGISISSLFLACRDELRLIGATRQLVGNVDVEGPPFAYCGSIGPINLPDTARQQLQQTGDVLARSCGLRGLFGCDFIFDGESVRLTEVNPRYTASVEIYEHALEIPLLAWHCAACATFGRRSGPWEASSEQSLPTAHYPLLTVPRIVAKRVLYASHDLIAPSLAAVVDCHTRTTLPPLADIPAAGMPIRAGHPICTVLASGADEADCRRLLDERCLLIESAVRGDL